MKLHRTSAVGTRKARKTRRPLELEAMERRQLLAIYTVVNNGDSGSGTLRQAILSSNSNPGGDTIKFALPATELTIAPLTPLPAITDSNTQIDATTQTNYDKTTGQPIVILSGSQLPTNAQGPGLQVTGGGATIKGLVIDNFASYAGITLSGSPGDLVQDCYIGTSANGLAAAGNGGNGISVGTSSCTIGGTGVTERNVISGNTGNGINITANKTTVQGNIIGLGADGSTILPNSDGIDMSSSVGNQIGGIAAGAGNVISGNIFQGIFIFVGGSTGDAIQGNLIGTDATGTVAKANGSDGILLQDAATMTIGGASGAGNVISGNGGSGIYLLGTNTKNVTIAGNKIGVAATGGTAVPNRSAGIWVNGAVNDVIGGASVNVSNVIANNGVQGNTAGVNIQAGSSIEILTNSIHDNANGGIALSPGSNGDLPAPVLTAAQTAAGQTDVTGSLTVDPTTGASSNFIVQFFASPGPDAAGKVEGQTFIGQTTVTTDANGNATFSVPLALGTTVGYSITATTTQQGVQNTSQFSAPITVTAAPTTDLKVTVVPNPSPDLLGTNETYTVTILNAGTNDDTNVVYTGTIDNNSAFVSATPSQGAAATFANNIITAKLGTIAAGKSATVTIIVSPAAVGTITLKSTATGDIIDTNPGNNTNITTTVTVNPAADIGVSISATPNPVAAGQLLTYVITVVNNGPSVATTVTLTDTLPAGLTNLNVDPGQGSLTSETATTIVVDLGDIPVGQAETVTITANAPTATGTIYDTASAQSATVADANNTNDSQTVPVQVEAAVNLGLTVAASPSPGTTNVPLTFTIAVTNPTDPVTGLVPAAATQAVLIDQLPAGIDPNSVKVATSQGTYTVANGLVTVNLGTINPDQSPPVTVTITVTPLSSGIYTNTASIVDNAEINVNSTSASVKTPVLVSPSDLAITVVANPTPAVVGNMLGYLVTVTNNGPADAPGTVAIDQFATSLALKSVTVSQGTYTISGQRITANLGTLGSGKSATMIILAVPTLSGPINDIAGVASSNVDPDLSNNLVTNSILASPVDLIVAGVSSTTTPVVGDPYVYGFVVYNAGPAPAVNAGVNIALPANATYAGAFTTQGFTGLANGVLSAALGTLAPNASATIYVTLVPTANGTQTATATAFTNNYDTNSSNNVATVTTTATSLPGTFVLASTSFAGAENSGSIPIVINRVNGTLGAIDVTYTTVDGSAKAGTNYTATAGTVHFADGQTTATVLVPVKDDNVITGNLAFYVAITGVSAGTLGSPAAAVVTEINTDRDLVPPEVVSVVPVQFGSGIAGYVIDFSKPLNPATATNAANYTLFASGFDAGTANAFIPVAAAYDAAANAVILVPSHPLALNAFYGLMINPGVTDLSGNLLDGSGGGVAGTGYGAYIGLGNSLTYNDSAGNRVNLAAAGAELMMTRNFSGNPYEIEVLGANPGHTVLAGTVRRVGGSSGVTTVGEIDGLGPFGSVNTNLLTSPPFFVAFSNFTPTQPIPQSVASAEQVGLAIPSGPRYVLARLQQQQAAAAAARRG